MVFNQFKINMFTVNRLKNEYNVSIRIPHDTDSNMVYIEGDPQGVLDAKKELLELADKLGNEKSRDIIIQQRLHRLIIGQSGSGIQKIRTEYPNVMVSYTFYRYINNIYIIYKHLPSHNTF